MQLINPLNYWEELRGALVEVKFTMQHYYISEKKSRNKPASNSFVIDLTEMKVLAPRAAPLVSPRKRKASKLHATSPLKRVKSNAFELDS
jgi:hypothetical protein